MLEKRSLSLAGHRTSIALEPDFWVVLTTIAAERSMPLARLIAEIDAIRAPEQKLASALRVFALHHRPV
ncbi:hypothetical protein ACOSOMT5_P2182 [Acidiphilium sp. MT5]